jgi:phosphotransferase system HPr (HPr) family protein
MHERSARGGGVIERETEIVNRLGLHARAAAKLVHTAGAFHSRVTVLKDGEEADAKSILGILLLAAPQGSRLTIRCEGADEEDAMHAVTGLIANRFDEAS